MKMNRLLLLVLALLLSFNYATAQKPVKVKIKKTEYQIAGNDAADAWKSLVKGTALFKQNKRGSYRDAIEYLQQAYRYNPDYPQLNYMLGVSYLKAGYQKEAQKYLEDALDLNPNVTPDIHLWLGRAYHLNYEFDEAIDEYNLYLQSLEGRKLSKAKPMVDRFIEECNNAIELSKKHSNVIISNMGEGVNTKYAEYAPVFAPYDSVVFFTSRRPSEFNDRKVPYDKDYYEDIYYTSYKLGKWYKAALFPAPVNSKANDASVAISPNGRQILIRRGYNQGTFLLSKYNKEKSKWSKPKPAIKKINGNKSDETTLTFSHDSLTVYFVSNRRGGVGGKDIWMTKRSSITNSGWSKPVNLGDVINTPYDEEAVFIADNDSTLYFASKGHNTIGGYDIFRSYLLPDGRWTEPENLGLGINTPEDDWFIFVNSDGRTGYFSSRGHDGEGMGDFDLYDFFFYTPKELFTFDSPVPLLAYFAEPVNEITLESPVPIKTMRLTVVKGTVTDYETGKPLNARIEITDNQTQKVIQTITTNATTGEFMVMLPSGKNYGMSVNAQGYMFHSENFDIPQASGYNEIVKDIKLMPINPGSKIVLRNVFFDFGKATLRPESYSELNRLADVLKKYPGMVIEISGHTDNIGSLKTNMRLSQKRAEAVVEYLVSQGVNPEQLIARGYGPTRPIASNKTEEGRQQNRRVEAKIISNPYVPPAQQQQNGN